MEVDQIQAVEVDSEAETITTEAVEVPQALEEAAATIIHSPLPPFRTIWIWILHYRRMLMVSDQVLVLPTNDTLHTTAPSPARREEQTVRTRGFSSFRGRGRAVPPSLLTTGVPFPGRGRGFDIPRRHVQGIGAMKDTKPVPMRTGGKQPLSSFLIQQRPLLRPIKFVPSVETRFLFQDEEDLLQPIAEDTGGQNTLVLLIFSLTVL